MQDHGTVYIAVHFDVRTSSCITIIVVMYWQLCTSHVSSNVAIFAAICWFSLYDFMDAATFAIQAL